MVEVDDTVERFVVFGAEVELVDDVEPDDPSGASDFLAPALAAAVARLASSAVVPGFASPEECSPDAEAAANGTPWRSLPLVTGAMP